MIRFNRKLTIFLNGKWYKLSRENYSNNKIFESVVNVGTILGRTASSAMPEQFYTLIFIKHKKRILLGMKKRGFGKGTWNGYGGKIEANETKFQCAIRELKEESNLTVTENDLKYLGDVRISNLDASERRIVHIFTTTNIQGDLKETEEMKPKWFGFNEVPYHKMMPDNVDWLPHVLRDTCFIADFIIDEANHTILEKNVRVTI